MNLMPYIILHFKIFRKEYQQNTCMCNRIHGIQHVQQNTWYPACAKINMNTIHLSNMLTKVDAQDYALG